MTYFHVPTKEEEEVRRPDLTSLLQGAVLQLLSAHYPRPSVGLRHKLGDHDMKRQGSLDR